MTIVKPIPLNESLLIDSVSGLQPSPLVCASLRDYIASGGNPNREAKGRALLEISVINGWVEETERLLEQGADVHADMDGALRQAADKGHTDIVRLLFVHGADIHAINEEALCHAANSGHTDIVRFLLAHDADVHVNNDEPLRLAALNQHKPITEVLLMAGASAATAVEHTPEQLRCTVFATLDDCAAAIQTDQRQGLLKVYGKQMPTLSALVQQEQRRARRRGTP